MTKTKRKQRANESSELSSKQSAWQSWFLAAAVGVAICVAAYLVIQRSSFSSQDDKDSENSSTLADSAKDDRESDVTNDDLGESQGAKPSESTSVTLTKGVSSLPSLQREGEDDDFSGWESEKLGSEAGKRLKKITQLMFESESPDKAASLLTTGFGCSDLSPTALEVFRDERIVVRRRKSPTTENAHSGVPGLTEAFTRIRGKLSDAEDIHSKYKVVGVELSDEVSSTRVKVQFDARGKTRSTQINAEWTCSWRTMNGDLLLDRIQLESFEEVECESAGSLFADLTGAILGKSPAYVDQLSYGADHWYAKLDVAFGVRQGNQGIAIADINGDDLEDLYVCQPAGLPNRLFLRNADGTLRDVSAASGVDWLDLSNSALFIDLDNDGDQDLVLVLRWSMLVHENDGQGRFEVRKVVETKFNLMSLVAADYDLDGDLDLYACGYSPGPETGPTDIFANPVPYHDANNGGRNFLMRNEGELHFKDVTEDVGLDENNRRFSFAAAWEDYDRDGDLDLYVANDFGRNNLYRNDDGKFADVAAEAGVEDIAAGMSVSWSDYDHDGWVDLYVSNMFSSAGNRIAYQRQFKSNAEADTISQLRRHARGNTLFRNLGNGKFADVSVDAGVTMGRWAWGSNFADINNDSFEDIYVANGFFTNDDTGDL